MQALENKAIMISLDSCLDIRLGELMATNQKLAVAVASNPAYYIRGSDDFETFDGFKVGKTYKQYLPKDPADVLPYCLTTAIFPCLFQLVNEFVVRNIDRPEYTKLEVHVNIYPYVLSEEETTEIKAVFSEKFHHSQPISIVRYSPAELNAALLVTKYLCMVLYSPLKWIDAQQEDLKRFKFSKFMVLFPKINWGRDFTQEEILGMKERGMNIWELSEWAFGPTLKIMPISVATFSALVPANPLMTKSELFGETEEKDSPTSST